MESFEEVIEWLLRPSPCAFCGKDYDNDFLYGKYIVTDKISFHENCMHFAGLIGEGNHYLEYLQFLLPDIEVKLRRGLKLICSYCSKRGATVVCCNTACNKSFHLPCGIEHGTMHQYFGSYLSFCKDHKPQQEVIGNKDDLFCHICCESIEPDQKDSCLNAPCCKNKWFHKTCIQKYAFSAGVCFKCPMCNNAQKFVEEMKVYGICVPEEIASWERDIAYEDLSIRPHCDATTCLCTQGREYYLPFSMWTLISCSYCGSHARHKKCENLKVSEISWTCNECKSMEEKNM